VLVARLGGDDNLAVASLELTHSDLTIDLGHNSGVGRVASLEKLGHTRQTTGDTTGTEYGAGNAHEGHTGRDGLAILDVGDMSAHREVVCSQHLSLVVDNVDHRNGVVVARLDDDTLGHT